MILLTPGFNRVSEAAGPAFPNRFNGFFPPGVCVTNSWTAVLEFANQDRGATKESSTRQR
jgi:hypothetical protein